MTMSLGGVVFLLPLVFITMILGKAFQLMVVVAKPVDKIIPLDSVGNVAFVNIVAAFAILLILLPRQHCHSKCLGSENLRGSRREAPTFHSRLRSRERKGH